MAGVAGVAPAPVFLATSAPTPKTANPATVGVISEEDPEDATKAWQAVSSTKRVSPGLRDTLQPLEKDTVALPLPVAKICPPFVKGMSFTALLNWLFVVTVTRPSTSTMVA